MIWISNCNFVRYLASCTFECVRLGLDMNLFSLLCEEWVSVFYKCNWIQKKIEPYYSDPCSCTINRSLYFNPNLSIVSIYRQHFQETSILCNVNNDKLLWMYQRTFCWATDLEWEKHSVDLCSSIAQWYINS